MAINIEDNVNLIFGEQDLSKFKTNDRNMTVSTTSLLKESYIGVDIQTFEVSGSIVASEI